MKLFSKLKRQDWYAIGSLCFQAALIVGLCFYTYKYVANM